MEWIVVQPMVGVVGVCESCGDQDACGCDSLRIKALVLNGSQRSMGVFLFVSCGRKRQSVRTTPPVSQMHECLLKMG